MARFRRKMTRRGNRKNFRRGTRIRSRNVAAVMRGGYRI